MTAITLCMLARKGGVGRTTTTLNIAGAMAKDGLKILCVDLDGQASLSRALLGSRVVESLHPSETSAALFDGVDPDPKKLIQKTRFEDVSLIAASNALEPYATPHFRVFEKSQHLVAEFLQTINQEHNIVLVDTPPNTSVLTVWAALVASDFVLSPVPADSFGTHSITSVVDVTDAVASGPNPRVGILGYFLSMTQKNAVNEAYRQTLRNIHGGMILNTEVPLLAAFKEAITERAPISHYKPRVKGAKIIRELATEISDRIMSNLEQKKAA